MEKQTTRTDAQTTLNINKRIAMDSSPEVGASSRIMAVIRMTESRADPKAINEALREVVLAPDGRASAGMVKETAISNITDVPFLQAVSEGTVALPQELGQEVSRLLTEKAGVMYRLHKSRSELRL